MIKVGSNILVNEKFKLRKKWLNSLVDDVAKLQKKGSKIIIVSSGAIALGRDVLQKKKLTNLHEKQAAASIGQIQLSQNWQRAFARSKIQSSQILITAEDLNERRKYLNIRNTIYSLMDLNVIPIINENELIEALKEEKIAGCGFNVYDNEPLSQNHKLRFLPNALLMPHIGYVTAENYSKFYQQMVENLESCLENKPLRIIS